MTPKPLALLALLVLSAFPLAAAQDEEGAADVTVWSEDRRVETMHEILGNTTLVIRGVTVELAEGITIQPFGKLVIEHGSVLKSADADGYVIDSLGAIEIKGNPDQPVVVDGLGGRGQNSGDTVLFVGGLSASGPLEARHARFVNYTSGIKASWNSTVALRDVLFNSSTGLGLVGSQGLIDADRVTFRGRGAGYWSAAGGLAFIRNSTMEDPTTVAVSSNGNRTVLENVVIRANEICVRNTVGILELYNVECTGFLADGIVISKPIKGFRMPNATIKGVKVSTTSPNASAGIALIRAPEHVIEDAQVGPMPRSGIVAEGVLPNVASASFQGLGLYNVVILNPSEPVEPRQIGTGASAREGWLFVGFPVSARVIDKDGKPLPGANFQGKYAVNDSPAFNKLTPESGLTSSSYLPVFVVGPDGKVVNHSYDLQAFHRERGGTWTREGFIPDGQMLLIQLETDQAGDNPVPGPALLPLLALLLGVALGARRHRRSG